MRFKIQIKPLKGSNTIPINYQYPFSAWVYQVIQKGDADFAAHLHDVGYTDGAKNFKLFSFSRLMVKRPKPMPNNRLSFQPIDFPVEVSFYLNEGFRPFLIGLFNEANGRLADKFGGMDFTVSGVQALAEPEWKPTMLFDTLSPVHVSVKGERHAKFLSPFDVGFEQALFDNLVHKYQAAHAGTEQLFDPHDFRFELASSPNKRKITVKEHQPDATQLIAHDFKCRITAPPELMRVAYHAGLGKSNALGFGMLREV